MEVNHFVVPAVAYPRYNYSRKHLVPLVERYGSLLERLSLKDTVPVPTFGDVNIYVIYDENSIRIDKENLTSKNTEKITCAQLQFPLDRAGEKTNGVAIYVATYNQTVTDDNILANTGKYIILLQEDGHITSPLCRGKNDEIICTTAITNLRSTIIILLEKIVFRTLFERTKVLQRFLELEQPSVLFATLESDTKSYFKQLVAKRSLKNPSPMEFHTSFLLWWFSRFESVKRIVLSQYCKLSQEFIENLMAHLLPDDACVVNYPVSQITEAILPVVNVDLEKTTDSHTPEEVRHKPELVRAAVKEMESAYDFNRKTDELTKSFTKHAEDVATHKNAIEELHGEIQGMYYRSKIPPFEMPSNKIEMSKSLDEKVARQILEVNGVTGVGYRFRILDIFLKDTLTETEQTQSEDVLRALLDGQNITQYLFHTESDKISPFAEVGSMITVKSSGTLGGFALLGKQKNLCVLLARHLADQGKPLYLRSASDSCNKTIFAHVLEPRNSIESFGSLDVSLAKVLKQRRKDCKVQFKDEEGDCRTSDICKYDDTKWLSGLPVHIWGAKSSPGLGKIVIPVLYMKDMEEKLMKIEDRSSVELEGDVKGFAKEGDSGAVVCANDPDEEKVYVLSMLIGRSHDSRRASKQEKVQYVSFRLINGLEQLKHEQNEELELC